MTNVVVWSMLVGLHITFSDIASGGDTMVRHTSLFLDASFSDNTRAHLPRQARDKPKKRCRKRPGRPLLRRSLVCTTGTRGILSWRSQGRFSTWSSLRAIASVRKTGFLSHLYLKVIFLPRQARDKHRENSKKARFVAESCMIDNGKAVFKGEGLTNNIWMNGLEVRTGSCFYFFMLVL